MNVSRSSSTRSCSAPRLAPTRFSPGARSRRLLQSTYVKEASSRTDARGARARAGRRGLTLAETTSSSSARVSDPIGLRAACRRGSADHLGAPRTRASAAQDDLASYSPLRGIANELKSDGQMSRHGGSPGPRRRHACFGGLIPAAVWARRGRAPRSEVLEPCTTRSRARVGDRRGLAARFS